MISILINDFRRSPKSRIILTVILTAFAIITAIFFSSRTYSLGNIALVPFDSQTSIESTLLNITAIKEAPQRSELIRGRFDAIVVEEENGDFTITTFKNEDFKEELQYLLLNPQVTDIPSASSRGPAATIFGYMTMFIMMGSVSMMFVFSDDKEKKQIERVAAAPVSFVGYLSAHGIFVFLTLYLPALVLLTIASIIPGISIGLGLGALALLLALLCSFSVCLSLLIHAFVMGSDNANMTGSALVVLTSILAGGFYAFDKGNPLLESIIRFLPQKAFFTVVEGVENGSALSSYLPMLLFVLIISVICLTAAVIKTRRDYVRS